MPEQVPTQVSADTIPDRKRPSQPYSIEDPALLYAWQFYVAYDQSSIREKRQYHRIRVTIIMLGIIASTLSVLSALPPFVDSVDPDNILIRVPLAILPITMAALLNYASQFTPILTWVVYRSAAEAIRREIYQYRTRAGKYGEADLNAYDRQEKLRYAVRRINKRIENLPSIEPFLRQYHSGFARSVNAYTDVPEKDNGFSKLSGDEYFEFRVIPQRNWYINRISRDHRNLRYSQAAILAFAVMGSTSVVIGNGYEKYVVLTTALGVAFTILAQLQMVGRTYMTYHLTAIKLEEQIARWRMLVAREEPTPAQVSAIVSRVERIFKDEINKWKEQAIQSQTEGEQALRSNIDELASNQFWIDIQQDDEDDHDPTTEDTMEMELKDTRNDR